MYYCGPKRIRTEKDNGCFEHTPDNIEYKEPISTVHDLCCDIWLEIFEYFETIELFTAFTHITNVVHQLLFNENEHFYSRGLTLDTDFKSLSAQIPLNCIISLTLHETCCLKIIDQCSKLRSLKLIGVAKWVTSIIKDVTHKEIKLEQLTIVTPRIECLQELLMMILSVLCLRRLEICVDDLEKNDMISSLIVVPSKIEQFILSSSSTIDWNSLLCMLPHFTNIRLLEIGLIDRYQTTIPSLIFQNLRTLSLGLLETPFNWIIQLLTTSYSLIKLKLTGLVNDEDFVINEKWTHLFELAPSLSRIFVNLSLEQDKEFHYCEKLQTRLRILNLQLTCADDNSDYYLYYGNKHRWWNLRGIGTKS